MIIIRSAAVAWHVAAMLDAAWSHSPGDPYPAADYWRAAMRPIAAIAAADAANALYYARTGERPALIAAVETL